MNKETSVYLDFLRFSAAMIVFLGHAGSQRFSGGFFWRIAPFGQDSVDFFFVISGFVIGYVVDTREISGCAYFRSRFVRIYSVAAPAIFLTIVLDHIGFFINPNVYNDIIGYKNSDVFWQIISGALFLNQTWWNTISVGSNLPFWSLGFEIWYYAIFGIIIFIENKSKYIILLLICLITGPKIVVMFPLWIMGWACYHFLKRGYLNPTIGLSIFGSTIIFYAVAKILIGSRGALWEEFSISPARLGDYGYHYLLGILILAHIAGFYAAAPIIGKPFLHFSKPIKWIAGATFTLYLFHFPILVFLLAIDPWPVASWASRGLIFIGTPIAVFGLAELTERRKDAWRRFMEQSLILMRRRYSVPR